MMTVGWKMMRRTRSEFEKALPFHALSIIENVPVENDPSIPRSPTSALSEGREDPPKSIENSLEEYFHQQVYVKQKELAAGERHAPAERQGQSL
jgi:hypothetical protein